MRIIFAPKARKQLDKIPAAEGRKITRKLKALEQNPVVGKKLSGELKDFYSLRAWPYRIIYRIYKENKTILIEIIEHRQGVYK